MTRPKQESPRSGRKAFTRTKVSLPERIISFSLVSLLAAIGLAVWIAGRNFDPGLYSLRTEALKSTEAPDEREKKASPPKNLEDAAPSAPTFPNQIMGRHGGHSSKETAPASRPIEDSASNRDPAPPTAGTPSEQESPDGHEAAPSAAPSTPAAKSAPIEIPGTKPAGDTEFYSPDSLYEKIDGRAPAYIEFHFQQLRTRSFSVPDNGGSYVDVYEYRMDSPVNAFGIFALERDPDGKPLDFATDGYSGEMGFFFRQGNCYVQVISSDQKPATMALARSVSEHLAKAIPADDAGLGARRRLPAQGLVPESVHFTQDNALGQAFLKDVFQADYTFDGKKISFFLMSTTPEAAAKAWESFFAFSGRYGGKAEALPDIAGAKVFEAQNFGKWKLIYQRDGELGGVLDAQDPVAARAFLGKVLEEESR